MNNFLPYSIKVWLFTAIAGPLFTTVYYFTNHNSLYSTRNVILRVVMIILFLVGSCIPFCAVFAGINKFLFKMQQDIKITKAIANAVGLLLGILPLMLLQSQNHLNPFYLSSFDYMWIYALTFTIAVWSFRIEQEVVVEKPIVRKDILDDDFNFGD